MSLTVLAIYGTRPEAIKMAPIIRTMQLDKRFSPFIVNTGQHRDLVDPINSLFGLEPDCDLDVMVEGQSLNGILSRVVDRVEPLLKRVAPDALIVQGDTTSVLGATLASFYMQIPVVHLEAGLRSGNIRNPFPEEANRKLVSQLADLHLAPTERNQANLVLEGVDASNIRITGNTVIDALHFAIARRIPPSDPNLRALVESKNQIVLVTTHRRENWGQAMENIAEAIKTVAIKHSDIYFVWPMHPNPTVRNAIIPKIRGLHNVNVCEPLGYGEFTTVMNASALVITDSGGIQEEAPALGIPVVVMRTNTERIEGLQAGTLVLAGVTVEGIVNTVDHLLTNEEARFQMSSATNPYGDGKATERSLDAIYEFFTNK